MKLVNSTLLITFLSHNASPLFYFVTSVIKIGCTWILILKNNWKMVWLITPSDSNADVCIVEFREITQPQHAKILVKKWIRHSNIACFCTLRVSSVFSTILFACGLNNLQSLYVDNCNFVSGIIFGLTLLKLYQVGNTVGVEKCVFHIWYCTCLRIRSIDFQAFECKWWICILLHEKDLLHIQMSIWTH